MAAAGAPYGVKAPPLAHTRGSGDAAAGGGAGAGSSGSGAKDDRAYDKPWLSRGGRSGSAYTGVEKQQVQVMVKADKLALLLG